jgi:hypothetical protein
VTEEEFLASLPDANEVSEEEFLASLPDAEETSEGPFAEEADVTDFQFVQPEDVTRVEAMGPDPSTEAVKGALGSIGSGAMTALSTLAIPASSLAQATGRVVEAGDAWRETDDIDAVIEGFKNPRIMRLARKDKDLPEGFDDAWKEATKRGKYAQAKFMMNEAFPLTRGMSDNLSDEFYEDFRKAIPAGYEDTAEAVFKFSANLAADPLMYSRIMAPLAGSRALGKARVAEIQSKPTEQILKEAVTRIEAGLPKSTGLAAEVARGERAALQVYLPFTGRYATVAKGEGLAAQIDNLGTLIESATTKGGMSPLRTVMTQSGLGGADAMSTAREFSIATGKEARNRVAEVIKGMPGHNDPKVVRLAADMSELGVDETMALYKRLGKNVSDTDVQMARELETVFKSVNNEIEQVLKSSGVPLKGFKPATIEEQAKAIEDLAKRTDNIPNIVVDLVDGTKADLTFSRGYDFGRRTSERVNTARRLKNLQEEYNAAIKGTGFMSKPDFLKGREKWSTYAQEELLAAKYGVKPDQVFDPNKAQILLDNYDSAARFAADFKYVQGLKARYGVNKGDVPKYIQDAKDKVMLAREKGISPSREDLMISRMSPDDFKPIDARVFNTFKAVVNKDDLVKLIPEELVYPSQVAQRIKAEVLAPDDISWAAGIGWLQKEWSRGVLASFGRVGRQGVENLQKLPSLGVTPMHLLKETKAIYKPDKISKLADNLPSVKETIWDLTDFEKKMLTKKFNIQMLSDERVMSGPNQLMSTYWQLAKDNKLGLMLDVGKKLAKTPKYAVEFANGNPASKGIRSFGASMDVLTKRAYFRKLIEDGKAPEEASVMVRNAMMDFSRTTEGLRKGRYVSPFVSFYMKNLEAIPTLISLRPGVINMLHPEHGELKRAFEDWSGWSPEVANRVAQLIPFQQHPMLGPLWRGNDSIVSDPEIPRQLFHRYLGLETPFGEPLSEADQQKVKKGMMFSLAQYNHLTAATDILDLSNINQNAFGPLMTAGALSILGYDPFRGRMLPTEGTSAQSRERIIQTLSTLNPAQYPTFYNKINDYLIENMDGYKETLQNPIPNDLMRILKINVGSKDLDALKLSDKSINDMVSPKFFGIGRVTRSDMSFWFQQNALFMRMDRDLKRLGNPDIISNPVEMKRIVEEIKPIVKAINKNTLIWRDYNAIMRQHGAFMDPALFEEINSPLTFAEGDGMDFIDEGDADMDTSDEYDDLEEVYREPQGSFDMQTDSALVNRASELTKEKMFPEAAQALQAAQDDIEVAPMDDFEDMNKLMQDLELGIPQEAEAIDFTDIYSPDVDRVPQSVDPVDDLISQIRDFKQEQELLADVDLSSPEGGREAAERLRSFWMGRINAMFPEEKEDLKQDILDTILQGFIEAEQLEKYESGRRDIASEERQ